MAVDVRETFFAILVRDMARATAFYVDALGAEVMFGTPRWTSVRIAGVRIGLALADDRPPARIGVHFVVGELAAMRDRFARAGGSIGEPSEVAPGVAVADATDTEGNTFSVRQG